MITEKDCAEILACYSKYITKEQMYQVCHISKKTCLFLLESGLVPNIDSGKRTHRFKIKTEDVIQYMRNREDDPQLYRPPDGYYLKDGRMKKLQSCNKPLNGEEVAHVRQYYDEHLAEYPEVMTVEQITRFTGYCHTSVGHWCEKKKLKCFYIRKKYYIPKPYLIDFLLSDYFMKIAVKSARHQALNKEIQSLLKVTNT